MTTNKLRARRSVTIDNFDDSLTEQNHASRCNISNILNKYRKTGLVTHNSAVQGSYADYPGSVDFHAMQNIIARSKSMFELIPSHIRAEFRNDPGIFVDFATDPDNRDALLEMGFSVDHLPAAAEPPPEPAPEPPSEPPPIEPGPVPTPNPEGGE